MDIVSEIKNSINENKTYAICITAALGAITVTNKIISSRIREISRQEEENERSKVQKLKSTLPRYVLRRYGL